VDRVYSPSGFTAAPAAGEALLTVTLKQCHFKTSINFYSNSHDFWFGPYSGIRENKIMSSESSVQDQQRGRSLIGVIDGSVPLLTKMFE